MGVAYAEYSTTAGQNLPDRGHGQYPDQQRHHSAETLIAHKLHYASLAVVSVLLVEVALKMMCSGSHFVKRKIEVFDAVIILASFVVDLVFIKGVPVFVVDESIFILAFLLPWRVIRVVNSLVVAVIDHEHVKLRLLYSRKKKLDKTVETLKNEVDELKGLLQDVRSLCLKEGLESWKIDNLLGKFAPRRRKDSKFYALVKLVMSTASVTDDRDSISSSSIENDIRAIANRDSVLNINDCSTSNYDIRSVASDVESYKDGYSSHSASPSPVVSPEISPCPSPNVFLRVPGGPSVFRFDDTQSMMSDELASRPSTPNILLTAPSTENTCDIEAMAETSLNSAPDGRTLGVGKEGVRSGSGGGARNETKTLKKGKAAKLHTPPSTPFLTVPNSHGRGHKPRISDSHSLTDLQFASRMPSRRSSCLSLNAEARGRRQKSPRRVNFDLS
ncbi:uncharacterized protein LOC112560322 isoform X2 [Pomacea canaliculata]|uniref:uncharacterized protein LOC112560322 isoform X2 n=1 Tax=Pomacea canaliculata TaxID=400727 RepID=UPI000D72AE1F|nr:uncharacterized protein LOC112560322 isoform X2 [Pomacea canaliculata]